MRYEIVFSILLVTGIIIYGFSFAFDYVKYSQTGTSKYSFLHNFPYELNYFRRSNRKSYLTFVTESFAGLLFIAASLMFALKYASTNPTSAFIIFTVMTLAQISFHVLRFIKLTNYRNHLIFVSINTVLNLFTLLLMYFFFTNKNYQYTLNNGVRIAEIVYLLILIILQFFLMLNPSYKNWYKMVNIEAEVYSRPKFCYLSILEWGNFLILSLSYLALLLILFF